MSTYADIYIAHDDGSFRNHLSVEEFDDKQTYDEWGFRNTLCSIDLNSLVPKIHLNDDIDPMWYFEHERDDVTICLDCRDIFVSTFGERFE